jgi:hypothetical protein
MKFRNLWLALLDQGPLLRFLRNFLITRNAWGLLHQNSHVSQGSGKPKVMYNTKATAKKAAAAMQVKFGFYYSNYKCLHYDGYHIGRNNWDSNDPSVKK